MMSKCKRMGGRKEGCYEESKGNRHSERVYISA